MKQKISEHFSDKVLFTNIHGKENVVTFRTTTSKILQDYYSLPKGQDEEAEQIQIIKTVAKLIKNNMKALDVSDQYPSTEDLYLGAQCNFYWKA